MEYQQQQIFVCVLYVYPHDVDDAFRKVINQEEKKEIQKLSTKVTATALQIRG